MPTSIFDNNGAEFSECRKYRYALWRIWDPVKPLVMVIGVNPSTANENEPDPTIKSVTRLATKLGYGGFYMMNCFPLVSADPKALNVYKNMHSAEAVPFAINNMKLQEIGRKCKDVIFAWGAFEIVRFTERDRELCEIFPNAKALIINKDGSPRHPLYVNSKKTIPIPYDLSVVDALWTLPVKRKRMQEFLLPSNNKKQ